MAATDVLGIWYEQVWESVRKLPEKIEQMLTDERIRFCRDRLGGSNSEVLVSTDK
jgi:hypothetical protein